MGLFKGLFDANAKEIKKYQKLVEKINAAEPAVAALSDAELQGKTDEFKAVLANGGSINDFLVEAFAVVREAAKRVLGLRHFDVQLIGGLALHDGRIAEMKTGEGKTLVATCPVYLNALTGKGVHVVTVNEYLARRDSEWMGRVYRFLGLSVGLIYSNMPNAERKAAYQADITFGTNSEFGFDYLRDNLEKSVTRLIQRELHYAIVDEVDSILIDEARTPLIISGPAAKPTERYQQMAKIAARMQAETDYTIDEKAKAIMLTDAGAKKAEQLIGIDNLYDDENTEINHHLQQAMRAQFLMKKDREYVVKDGEVIIVDEFTGRLMFGRRFNEGLHQAIEAKEGVKVARENQTLATITLQNYFKMYQKLAGMTGTAMTEEEEFQTIYGLDVVEIPTNKPLARNDMSDVIYRTEGGKFNAVIENIAERHANGQPVLVGTVSIEKSEELSQLLKKRGIPHQVLNAKFHEQEAEIVAQAGRYGAVTIATNMAGRGTDIMLGGNPQFLAQKELAKLPEDASLADKNAILAKYEAVVKEEREKVVAAGGLAIIGTERHESRRIDNQLRGRAGRQGDVGSSQFFISVEDDVIRRFAGDSLANMMTKIGMGDDMPLENPLITRSIENAQKKVEAKHFDSRRYVLEYDNVMNQQRTIIYEQRRDAMTSENIHEQILFMLRSATENIVNRFRHGYEFTEEWDLPVFLNEIEIVAPQHGVTVEEVANIDTDEVLDLFYDKAKDHLEKRREEIGEETFTRMEKDVLLRVVDRKWMDHIDAIEQFKQGVSFRAFGKVNPLDEFKNGAFDMFNEMIADIQQEVSRLVQRSVVIEQDALQAAGLIAGRGGMIFDGETESSLGNEIDTSKLQAIGGGANKAAPVKKQPIVKSAEEKIGRNDPCPCGSGKKYKQCCGKNN